MQKNVPLPIYRRFYHTIASSSNKASKVKSYDTHHLIHLSPPFHLSEETELITATSQKHRLNSSNIYLSLLHLNPTSPIDFNILMLKRVQSTHNTGLHLTFQPNYSFSKNVNISKNNRIMLKTLLK